jgi:hypothetical protein
MSGYTKDENSLATGIPDRTIGPETGGWGNATKTNRGDTSQGTNQGHEVRPAPAAGLQGDTPTIDNGGEHRSFAPGEAGSAKVEFPPSDIEPVYQQIADGGDHFDHDKHLGDDKVHKADKHRRERDVE